MAVAAANCINIPIMRQRELIGGIMVTDEEGNNLAKSKVSQQELYARHQYYSFPGGGKGRHFSGHPEQDFHSHSYNE